MLFYNLQSDKQHRGRRIQNWQEHKGEKVQPIALSTLPTLGRRIYFSKAALPFFKPTNQPASSSLCPAGALGLDALSGSPVPAPNSNRTLESHMEIPEDLDEGNFQGVGSRTRHSLGVGIMVSLSMSRMCHATDRSLKDHSRQSVLQIHGMPNMRRIWELPFWFGQLAQL